MWYNLQAGVSATFSRGCPIALSGWKLLDGTTFARTSVFMVVYPLQHHIFHKVDLLSMRHVKQKHILVN